MLTLLDEAAPQRVSLPLSLPVGEAGIAMLRSVYGISLPAMERQATYALSTLFVRMLADDDSSTLQDALAVLRTVKSDLAEEVIDAAQHAAVHAAVTHGIAARVVVPLAQRIRDSFAGLLPYLAATPAALAG